MTSLYSTYADHNANTINSRRVARHAAGDGMAWGSEDMTPREAAEHMGAAILSEYTDGMVLADLSDRLYMVSNVGGPWAVEVASQDDLDA